MKPNTEAERHILAGMLKNPEKAMRRIQSEGITAEYFIDHRCRQLFPIITELYEVGRQVHIPLIHEQPEIQPIMDDSLRFDISDIRNKYNGMELFASYLPIIRKDHAARIVHRIAVDASAAIEQGENPETVSQALREGTEHANMTLSPSSSWKTAKQACIEFADTFQDLMKTNGEPGIQTGLDDLDKHTGGMRPGELWVVSGQTSGGKSVAALQFTGSAIDQNKRAAVFSLEMMAEENIARMIANKRNVHYGFLRNPKQTQECPLTGQMLKFTELDRINMGKAINDLKDSRMLICDQAGLTIERIDAMCQEMHEDEPLELIVIDYIQLVRTTRKNEPRHEELAWIAGCMKQMAKKYRCPVITASQLNIEGRMAKAKSIGDDADVALRIEGEEGIYVLKNRNGPKHMYLPFVLKGEYQRFEVNYAYGAKHIRGSRSTTLTEQSSINLF
jgi:replicative DNA helicase